MIRTFMKYSIGRSKPQSIREFTDKSKAGWSRKQKLMAYMVFGLAGLKMYTHIWQVDLIFTFVPTPQNMEII